MKSFFTILIIIVIGSIAWIGLTGDNQSDQQDLEEGNGDSKEQTFDKAPDFTLEDYDGNEVSLADFSDKILILNSWATWCPFCVDELPDFGTLQEEFPDEIVVIAIDRAESLDKAKEFTDNLEVTDKYIFLLDPKDSFYQSIGGFAMPETLFVDSDLNIRVHKRGPLPLSEMRKNVESIINS